MCVRGVGLENHWQVPNFLEHPKLKPVQCCAVQILLRVLIFQRIISKVSLNYCSSLILKNLSLLAC